MTGQEKTAFDDVPFHPQTYKAYNQMYTLNGLSTTPRATQVKLAVVVYSTPLDIKKKGLCLPVL